MIQRAQKRAENKIGGTVATAFGAARRGAPTNNPKNKRSNFMVESANLLRQAMKKKDG